MKRVILFVAASLLLLTTRASVIPAYAHGGSYRPPAGEVPPGQRDPKDPQPAPDPTGPSTGGDHGGPVTPPDGGPSSGSGGDNGGPANPGGPVAGPAAGPGPIGGPAGGPGTGGRRSPPPPMGQENWFYWWSYNKDEILDQCKAGRRRGEAVPDRSSPFTFGSGGTDGPGVEPPTVKMLTELVVPALEKTIENPAIHPDIRGGALIALARCPGTDHRDLFVRMADRSRKDDQVVMESAILALGISQTDDTDVRDFLISLIRDDHYPSRARCFAMISLGLLQDRRIEAFQCLRERVDGREKYQDLPVCALLAIGLIGDQERVPEMIGWLENRRIDTNRLGDLESSWVIAALGRIGDPRALKAVSAEIGRKGLLTRRSAMIALGQLVPRADEKIRSETLSRMVRALENESDLATRNFGMIAMGRIAGSNTATPDMRKATTRYLLHVLDQGATVTEKPFAALALGLVGLGEDKPEELRYSLAEPIRRTLAELKGDRQALGAQAIALGMLRDRRQETVTLLSDLLKDRTVDRRLRGASAVALGLIGDTAARKVVLNALAEREDRDLRIDTAVAAGLLGDSDAVPELVEVLNDAKASQFVLGSVALALGQIGDHRAIPPLISILDPGRKDGTYPDLTRALTAVALGQIAELGETGVLFRISKDVNYRAIVPSLVEILTIL